jgi:hypothetical protein
MTNRIAPQQPDTSPGTDEHRALVAKVQSRLLQQLDTRFETEVRNTERLQRYIAVAVDAVLE